VINVPTGTRERQERFTQIVTVDAAVDELSPPEHGDPTRNFWFVPVAIGADCFGGHCSQFPPRNKASPPRYAGFFAGGRKSRESVRYQCGADIQTIGQKFFQLERHRVDRRVWHSLSRFVSHFGAAVLTRLRTAYAPFACAVPKILAELGAACNDSKLE